MKLIKRLVTAILALSMIPVFATVPQAAGAYYRLDEDFSEYTSSNAHTAAGDAGAYYHHQGEGIIAERDDGVKWITSTVWKGGLATGEPGVTIKGASYLSDTNNHLSTRAYGDMYPAITKLDLGTIYTPASRQAVEKISFSTGTGAKIHAAALYINETESEFYVFGKATNDTTRLATSNLPFVAKYKNSSFSLLAQAPESQAQDWRAGDSQIDWTVTNVNGKISYKCVGSNGMEWVGSFEDTDGYADNWKWLAGQYCVGDAFNKLLSFTLETGDYYTGGMGEPSEVLYSNLAAGVVPVQDADGNFVYDFGTEGVVRRVKSRRIELLAGGAFSLSTDGVNWDDFTMTANVWFNDRNENAYRYLKSTVNVADLFVLTECASGSNIVIGKGSDFTVYFYDNGTEVYPVWNVDDARYASIDSYGKITGHKDGATFMEVTGTDGEFILNITVKGPMTIVMESGTDAEKQAYIGTQQSIIDTLNTAISAGIAADISTFMTPGSAGNDINDLDAVIELPDILGNMTYPEIDGLCSRLLNYTQPFTVTSIDDIKAFEQEIIREIAVGDVCNKTTANDVETAIESNNSLFKLPTDKNYFTDYKQTILNSLVNVSFLNYDDLYNKFAEAVLMTNVRESLNGEYILTVCEEYKDIIGYNQTLFNSVSDKVTFGNYIKNNKAAITSVALLKTYLDNFTTAPLVTPAPAPAPAPSYDGGGGGGGGVLKPKPVVTAPPVKEEPEPFVEKRVIFEDVPVDTWEYEAVRFLVARDAISGYDDGTFKSKNEITRAEFIKILISSFNIPVDELVKKEAEEGEEPAEEIVLPFNDITLGDWFTKYIVKVHELGLINGSDGAVRPNDRITKQEMASIIFRALNNQGRKIDSSVPIMVFHDSEEISDWALESVNKLQAYGIINGENGYFRPLSPATRAETAQIIYSAIIKTEPNVEENQNE